MEEHTEEFRFIEHFGSLCVARMTPIQLAKIPIIGDSLQDSVLLHPRHVPKGRKYEIVTLNGFVRGKTLDILLDEPITVDGEEYQVLTFKGVGAHADREFVIAPEYWWSGHKGWIPRDEGDRYKRPWGSMWYCDGKKEYDDTIVPSLGVKAVKHVAYHSIPEGAVETPRPLGQLIRASKTNVRMELAKHMSKEQQARHLDAAALAHDDLQLLRSQMRLVEEGLMFCMDGVADNRLIDGTYIDRENCVTRQNTESEPGHSPRSTCVRVWFASYRHLEQSLREQYENRLRTEAGIVFDHRGGGGMYMIRMAIDEYWAKERICRNDATSPRSAQLS